jgi:DNA-binding GntR family transcriptional regulator
MTGGGRRAVERIAETLRDEILSGALEAGMPMREEPLAERFGASRHTVRSALGMLTAERLATAEAYRGVRVTRLDDQQVRDLQQVRGAIETEVVTALEGADLGRVRRAITVLEETERADRPWLEVERAHAAVHQALVDTAGNRRLSDIYRQLEGELSLLLLHSREAFAGRDLAREHRDWLDDLSTRGPVAVREHLDRSMHDVLMCRRVSTAH